MLTLFSAPASPAEENARRRRPPRGGYWPTPLQEWLLRAALLPGEEGREAWRSWRRLGGDVTATDAGSHRLLGHVYRNLAGSLSNEPEVERLRGLYRHTWCRNQLRFHRLGEVLTALEASGIPTLVLKGAALTSLHYGDAGLRPMDDLDVLVPAAEAARALRSLAAMGFGPPVRSPEDLVSVRHSIGLEDASAEQIDLHWHVLWECFSAEDDEPFWRASVPVTVGSCRTRSLCATDLLLHVCLHGAMWNPVPPIRWVVDAAMIVRSAGSTAGPANERPSIDWSRLVTLARRFRQTDPAEATLSYLRRALDLPIPEGVLADLARSKTSRLDRLDHEIRQRPGRVFGGARLLLGYRRWIRSRGAWPSPASLVTYLQRTWDLPHPARVPGAALARLYGRVRAAGRRSEPTSGSRR